MTIEKFYSEVCFALKERYKREFTTSITTSKPNHSFFVIDLIDCEANKGSSIAVYKSVLQWDRESIMDCVYSTADILVEMINDERGNSWRWTIF